VDHTAPKTSPEILNAAVAKTVNELKSNLSIGLTEAEVQLRRTRFGANQVPEKKARWIGSFAKRFWGVSAWMIELIIVLTWLLNKRAELVVSAVLLVVNALIGFFEDRSATRAVEALQTRLRVSARVLRDSAWKVVPAQELVPGDIVRLRAGDFIPADAQVTDGQVSVDQSTLTGESTQVAKRPSDAVYSGSVVRRGETTAIVVLTGIHTYFGRMTQLVQSARPHLHVEEVIARVVRWLFLIVSVLIGTAMGVALIRGISLAEILPLTLVLLLSAVPVALPVMFTVSMAIGAMEMARKGVLVTRLSAAEDAANMDVLCIDKTGTITMNRLSTTGTVPLSGYTENDVIRYGALASEEANQDPIDMAFLAAVRDRGLLSEKFKPVTYIPFSPETRRTEAIIETADGKFRVMKGALRSVAQVCGMDAAAVAELESRAAEQAKKGYRVLAVASSAAGSDRPELTGLVMLHDAPRRDSRELIAKLQGLGVEVKMLTGDAAPIAEEVAKSVGLGQIRSADELRSALSENPAGAAHIIEGCGGFAEVLPEDKFLVVRSLQSAGHVTGMTGDGVNDAPALKQAEVGIAVSSATDVAKAAASVVLTTEGLTCILPLVTGGRIIYQRILTWIVNKISRTILKAGFVTLAFLVTGKFVISAFGMLLLVFMTDFVKITLSTDRAGESRHPQTWKIAGWVKIAVALGVLLVVEALGLLALAWHAFGLAADLEALHTFSFLTLLFFALFSLVSIRERRAFWASMPSEILLVALVLDGLIGLGICTLGVPGLRPIPLGYALTVLGYSFTFALVVNDFVKRGLIRSFQIQTGEKGLVE
jgi:H+-transporting ATPase